MKAAVAAGNLDDADTAWALYEEARAALPALLAEITDIERVLYSHRRQRR